jgi:hypothetical protein
LVCTEKEVFIFSAIQINSIQVDVNILNIRYFLTKTLAFKLAFIEGQVIQNIFKLICDHFDCMLEYFLKIDVVLRTIFVVVLLEISHLLRLQLEKLFFFIFLTLNRFGLLFFKLSIEDYLVNFVDFLVDFAQSFLKSAYTSLQSSLLLDRGNRSFV